MCLGVGLVCAILFWINATAIYVDPHMRTKNGARGDISHDIRGVACIEPFCPMK